MTDRKGDRKEDRREDRKEDRMEGTEDVRSTAGMGEVITAGGGGSSVQNVTVLSLMLALGLLANLLAFPVILFRRTRFGNGQFAVLILCLTSADLLTVVCGLLGGVVLEAGSMAWVGSSMGKFAPLLLTNPPKKVSYK